MNMFKVFHVYLNHVHYTFVFTMLINILFLETKVEIKPTFP